MDDIDRANESLQAQTDRMEQGIRRRRELQDAAPRCTERDCNDCGYPIPAQRLKLLPWTLLCFDCQSFVELRR